MTSSERTGQRRKAARKANGSGTIKKRKDGRYEGQEHYSKPQLIEKKNNPRVAL